MGDSLRMEIDGHTPTEAEYRSLAISQYGHFTAMGVRGGRTRGRGDEVEVGRLGAPVLLLPEIMM